MDIVTMVLGLVLAVVVSAVLSGVLPVAIPRPLVQITLGAAIGLVSHLRVELDPEIFFLLFLPPLLFLDGWRIPKDELYKDRHDDHRTGARSRRLHCFRRRVAHS